MSISFFSLYDSFHMFYLKYTNLAFALTTFHCSKKSEDHGKQNSLIIKPPIYAVPFSDEWLAAMEAAGEVMIHVCGVCVCVIVNFRLFRYSPSNTSKHSL